MCAWFDFGREETAAFHAEMDALPIQEATGAAYVSRHPGKAHAAGRDACAALALALAQWVSGQGEKPPRNILIIFQPSGESGGAERLCGLGVLGDYRVSRIFSLLLRPGLPAGQVFSRPGALLARSNSVAVGVEGKSAPLSRAEEGVDAMRAAIRFLDLAYGMAAEAPPPCIMRFGRMSAGTSRDTISASAELEGTLLTYQEGAFIFCRDRLAEIARTVERTDGCKIGVRIGGGYPAVWNNEALYAAVSAGLSADGGGAVPETLEKPLFAAEDFSFYQQAVPGALFFLGAGDTPELRSPEFDFDDEAVLPPGLAFLQRLAMLD